MSEYRNRLANEKSPYLLQHAGNPVDWYPWSDEAFEKARKEDKPVFLSIGYSTCHWCHVMERESFEDPAVAEKMKEVFVSIKVDREERPDIDHFYMNVIQMLNGSGGWPLNVILTPDRQPIFALTYIPKVSRQGQMGIMELCDSVKELWKDRRSDLVEQAGKIVESVGQQAPSASESTEYRSLLGSAFDALSRNYEPDFGGFGTRPKFPTPHNLSFLLRHYLRSGEKKSLEMAEHTLRSMREGGIFDQVGFGFHRYSTDVSWTVPHFEKMLYDQALLLRTYSEAYMVTDNEFYADVASEIVQFMAKELQSPDGAFYSALDADSEGEEGKYYTWSTTELRVLLGNDYELFSRVYPVTDSGNYHDEATGRPTGKNVLRMAGSIDKIAESVGMDTARLQQAIERFRKVLLEARSSRKRPGVDNKVLTDINSLVASGLAVAYIATGNGQALEMAERTINFIQERLVSEDRVLHSWIDGRKGSAGFLPDYSFLVCALIDLYQATLDRSYLESAKRLNRIIIEEFGNPAGGFYFTRKGETEIPAPTMDDTDGAVPSGNSMCVFNLARLRLLVDDPDIPGVIEKALSRVDYNLSRNPMYFSQLMCAIDMLNGPLDCVEWSIRDDRMSADLMNFIRRKNYHRFLVKSNGTHVGVHEDAILVCGENSCLPGMRTLEEFKKWACA